MDITFMRSLHRPNGGKPKGRRVWGIDLEAVWLPYLTAQLATNTIDMPLDAIGAPLRLGYNADGTVKFNTKSGKPVIKIAKPIQDEVRLMRENLVAGMLEYAHTVVSEQNEAYKTLIAQAQDLGKPILERDKAMLESAIAEAVEVKTEVKVKPKAKREAVAV